MKLPHKGWLALWGLALVAFGYGLLVITMQRISPPVASYLGDVATLAGCTVFAAAVLTAAIRWLLEDDGDDYGY